MVYELSGVCAEAFSISSLSFPKKGIHDQGGFSGAGSSGEDDELVCGDYEINIFQIIFSSSFNFDVIPFGKSDLFHAFVIVLRYYSF